MRPPRFRLRTLMVAVAVAAVVLAILPASWWEAFRPRPVVPKIPTNRAEALAYANYHVGPERRRGYLTEIIEVDPAKNGGRYIVCFVKPGRTKFDAESFAFLILDSGYCMTTTFVQESAGTRSR